jgi:thiol:disulfide interchange protein DsbC
MLVLNNQGGTWMKKQFLSVAVIMLVFFAAQAYGFSQKGQNCAKCHSLKKEDAQSLLKSFDQNIRVMEIRTGPVKYLWEVDFEANGKKGLIYIDFSKKHLFSGSLIEIQGKQNLTQYRLSEINKINTSQIPLQDAIILGNKNAKNKLIVFSDPECPYCAKLHQEMKKVVKERKDIAFYIKMFPLKIHPGAYDKAKTIVCEKSLKLLEDAYNKKSLPAPKCKTSVVDETIKIAEKLGITSDPTVVLPDGRIFAGSKDADALKALVDKK